MSIFPYIYYMIESFHITNNEQQIALYVGMVISAFALAEAMSSCLWGRLSDKLGRKPILLCGLAGTGISMLVFGFATNIYVALLARALGGLLNGNIGVLQTTISKVVKNEAHKGVGFALMPAVWCVGAAIGSALGGSLADPVRSYPGHFQPGGILDRFPYLLPNLVCLLVVIVAIIFGSLFLEETHEDLKEHRDYGLQVGAWLEGRLRRRPQPLRVDSNTNLTMETLALLHEGEPPPDYKSAASSPGLPATAVGSPPPYHDINCAEPHDRVLDIGMPLAQHDIEAADRKITAIKQTSGVWNTLTTQIMLNIVGLGILA